MKESTQIINCTTILLRINLHPVGFMYTTSICLIITAICSIAAVVLNVLTLLAVYTNKSLQIVQNIFICNTAVCDILFSMVVVPLWSYIVTSALFDKVVGCNPALALSVLSNFIGVLEFTSLSCITMDQYLAITKPYFYHYKIRHTGKYYIIICIGIWMFDILVHIINITTPKRIFISIIIAIITPTTTAFCIYCNYKIYTILKRVRKTSRAQSMSTTNSPNNIADIVKERKFLMLTSLMLVSLILCYFPYLSILILRIIKRDFYEQSDIVHLAYQIACTLIFTKPLINPILYCYQLTPLRDTIKKLCTRNYMKTNPVTVREIRSTTENSVITENSVTL